MLSPGRALKLNTESGRELPRVEALKALYDLGVRPRHGEVIMVAGRSGTQKSGFALWWTAQMGLPTLYLSADMSAFTASSRIASMQCNLTTEQVESALRSPDGGGEWVLRETNKVNTQFAFGKITWPAVDAEIEAYVELHNAYPEVVVFDNLMDIEGCASDYVEQMEAMDIITDLSRNTGATSIILHHASDKGWEAKTDPWAPPSRDQIKNGLSEKPELSLSVGLDPHSNAYRIACLKQRMGFSDPTGQTNALIRAVPSKTQFVAWGDGQHII